MTAKVLNNILVKPAGPDCNMDCLYCFYKNKPELFPETGRPRMSEFLLEAMIRQIVEPSGGEVSIGWQGGEPTLMGLPFYRKAVELEERFGAGKIVGNGLQTNGLLIDRQWARFFREFRFLIGLSIDGPEHVHDHYRRMRGGGTSWSRVADRAKLMLDEGISVNALTVVNDYSSRFPEEIYSFHKALGLTFMQFIPCVETHPLHRDRVTSYSVSAKDFGKFLCRTFDLWISDFLESVPTTSIRFFESLLLSYAGFIPPECTLYKECGVYLVVEHQGDVYSCDFFVEPAWKLGNIAQGSLTEMLNSPRQLQFGKYKSNLPKECRPCEWLSLCRGGCPRNRIRSSRDGSHNHLCQAYKMLFEHADPVLKRLAYEWQRKQNNLKHIQSSTARVGRNEPCPCGSGKKFKKCCGRLIAMLSN